MLKDVQHLNEDYNFEHKMSLSKKLMLVFKQLLTFFIACCSIALSRGARKLTGDDLKLVCAKFSTIS